VRARVANGEDIAGWLVQDDDCVAMDRASWDEMYAETARLRAEVERLKGERDAAREAGGEARIAENEAEHARVSMSLRATKLEADRAALAQRVAVAVREACAKEVGTGTPPHVRIRAADLGHIVAAALKESAP
jgi:hypothetical protein